MRRAHGISILLLVTCTGFSAAASADDPPSQLSADVNDIALRNCMSPITLLPTNILEVFDGGVQASLSAIALLEERREMRLPFDDPPMLTAFLSDSPTEHYPPLVWQYLNHRPAGANLSRRKLLITSWKESGLLENAGKGSKITI